MNFSTVFLVALAISGAANVNAGPIIKSNGLTEVSDEFGALVPNEEVGQLLEEHLLNDAAEFPGRRLVDRSVELERVMRQFADLVPRKKIKQIWGKYLSSDKEFIAVVEYFFSDAFKELVRKVEHIDDVINVYHYLEEAGLDVRAMVNGLHFLIDLPLLPSQGRGRNFERTGGVAGFFADYKAILPVDKIKALHKKKLETSPAFAFFVGQLRSPRFQKLIDALWANEEFQRLHSIAKKGGIDVEACVDLYTAQLGIEFPSKQNV